MTIRDAVATLQRILITTVEELKKQEAPAFAQAVDDAWKIVREAALKAENRLPDARTTTKGMFIPESPSEDKMSLFMDNVDESLNELYKKIMRCETDIEMLWNAVEAIRDRLPKEWGK